jgi:antitoxin component of RelBE/YafQ-DinJ toxin-antitoxin module
MPNQPKTPLRNVRVDDQLWTAVQAKAAAQGRTVSDVIRDMLRRYVR